MSDQIKNTDVVQKDLFKNTIESAKDLLKELDTLEEKYKEILKLTQQEIKRTHWVQLNKSLNLTRQYNNKKTTLKNLIRLNATGFVC